MHSDEHSVAYRAIKVGNPHHHDTRMGALVSKEHREKVRGFVQEARDIGATVHCGEGVDKLDLPDNVRLVGLGGGVNGEGVRDQNFKFWRVLVFSFYPWSKTRSS